MQGMTLICVVAISALIAALSFLPTSEADGPECVSGEPCPAGEHCVQYAGGNFNNFRSCLPAVGEDENCGFPGNAGVYVSFPPCEEGFKCILKGGSRLICVPK